MILSLAELADLGIMAVCLGYIFARYVAPFNTFKKPNHYDIVGTRRFNRSDFIFAILLFAPAVLLHELGHKFVAIAFGYNATFFSALSINKFIHGMPFFDFPAILMLFALVSTYFGFQFLFFVPAYVAFSASATPIQQAAIAFAGPAVNLILWLGTKYLVYFRVVKQKYVPFTIITSRINMILFAFNMLPIPGLDGFKVYAGLFQWFFH